MRAGHECYHCKQWVEPSEAHDCWTTTEAALTRDLSEDLRDAWERIRETAVGFGEQRIYASHHSIMFARKVCYFFVRPKPRYLELCVFLPRLETSRRIRKVYESSTAKRAHMLRVIHRDEIEAPLTDWLREAYDFADPNVARHGLGRQGSKKRAESGTTSTKRVAKKQASIKNAAANKAGDSRRLPGHKAPGRSGRPRKRR